MLALAILHGAVAGILLGVLVQTLLNHRTLLQLVPRPPCSPRAPRVAVLIPARNEADGIARAVRGWLAQDYPAYEVIVLDDASCDGTGRRAAEAGGVRVRVVRNDGLPDGWRGKPHACHRLRAQTAADILIFADADICPTPGVLAAAIGALEALGAEALSALPHHESPSLAVRALAALQNWAPLALVPLWSARARRRPMFAVTNGQFLVVRAEAYDRAGGFETVREALGEDAAFGRRLVSHGAPLALVDGARLLRCHPYRRARAAWDANVRNLESALLGSRALLVTAAAVICILVLVPPAILAWGVVRGAAGTILLTWLPLAEIALLVAPRTVTDARAGYPRWLALSHPVALLATAVMAFTAACPRREVRWRGRRYAARVDPARS